MSRTTIADPSLIPDIEAFEERVDPHPRGWHSNLPSQGPGCTSPGLPQSGALLGLVEGLRGEEEVGVGCPRKKKLCPSGGWALDFS
jgi:hypothetical protein